MNESPSNEDKISPESSAPKGVADRRSSELKRMGEPISKAVGVFLRFLHWPILVLVILYFASGITTVKSDEVALVLRFGKLVGETKALSIRQPGILFALPRPMDEVVRVNVKKIHELAIDDLASPMFREGLDPLAFASEDRIDPTVLGYCITGDQNIVHAMIVVRYQVSDPVEYALGHQDPHKILRDAVISAVTHTVGELPVLQVMRRENLPEIVRRRTQEVLERTHAGVSLVAIEFQQIFPPDQVLNAFFDVQNEFNIMFQNVRRAESYQKSELQNAKAKSFTMMSEANMFASRVLGEAKGESAAFESLVQEYKKYPKVLLERVYREAIEEAIDKVTRRRFVPPPVHDEYKDLRITIPANRGS